VNGSRNTYKWKNQDYRKAKHKKDEILCYDEEKQAYRVAISAPPEDNKANIAVIKFFARLTKKNVTIVSGLTSKTKNTADSVILPILSSMIILNTSTHNKSCHTFIW